MGSKGRESDSGSSKFSPEERSIRFNRNLKVNDDETSYKVKFDDGGELDLEKTYSNTGTTLFRGYKSENDADSRSNRRISFAVDNSNLASRKSQDNLSQRSRASSVSQVKWRPILDEIANDSNAYEVEGEENSISRFSTLLEEIEKAGEYSRESFNRIQNLFNEVADDIADERRKYKKHITKLGNQVERLKEKVEVNILLDSRVKDQKERLEELERENRILRGLDEYSDENSSVRRSRRLRLESQLMFEPAELELSRERLSKVTRRRQVRAKQDKRHQLSSPVSGLTMDSEMSSMFVNVLRENNNNYRKTNDQLIKVNENLLNRNQSLVAELETAKATFREEQNQWQKNWDKLKEHYEMQINIIKSHSQQS